MNKKALLLLCSALLLSGCNAIIKSYVISSMESSLKDNKKNIKSYFINQGMTEAEAEAKSEAIINETIPKLNDDAKSESVTSKDLKASNHKVYVDAMTISYSEELESGIFAMIQIPPKDEKVLRNLFSGSVGLLTPQFAINKDTLFIEVDWNETQRKHDYLTKTLHLKLLPLSVTKQFYERLVTVTKKMDIKKRDNAGFFTSMLNFYGLSSKDYYEEVLSKLGNFEYLVESPFVKFFYTQEKEARDTLKEPDINLGYQSKPGQLYSTTGWVELA